MLTPPFRELLYGVDGHICTLTLNRPEKRNALSARLVNELIFAIETASEDPEVRVIISPVQEGPSVLAPTCP